MNPHKNRRFATLVPMLFVLSASFLFAEGQAQEHADPVMVKKLQTIMLPKVELKQVSFTEALEIIRKQSCLHDPEEKGVNFYIRSSAKDDRKFTRMFTNISLADVLRRLCDLSDYSMKIKKHTIVFEGTEKAILFSPLMADEAKPNLDDPAKLEKTLAEALNLSVIEKRGDEGEELFHAPDSQEPYTGWVKRMYENGKVHGLLQIKKGKPHGLATMWHENGQKRGEDNYKDGKMNGLTTTWYENGQKRRETNYVDGELNGLWKGWYENGQKRRETNYVDGKKHGLHTEWDGNGKVTSQTKWENGEEVEKVK